MRRIPIGKAGSLGDVVCERVGVKDGVRVLAVLCAWAWWLDRHDGEAPTLSILAGTSEKSRAQWFRDASAFERAFPDEEGPDRIARLVWAESRRVRGRMPRTPLGFGGMPWPEAAG